MFLTCFAVLDAVGDYDHHHRHHDLIRAPSTTQERAGSPDRMLVDDQKHTIYIQNLDRELADIDLPQDSVAFLPGIEERLASVPRLMLADNRASNCGELVLYREPESLLEPNRNSYVRRALVETRERARACHKAQVSACSDVPGSMPLDGVSADMGSLNNTIGGDMMEIDSVLGS